MNDKKIAFITCTNDEMWYEECVKYLAHLEVPEGYEIDLIKVTDAVSMTSGYNEGMNASDAKYKIYLHHDIFIVRKDFLKRVIQVFQEHSEIGVMGVLGTNRIVESGSYWNHWDIGQAYAFNAVKKAHISLANDGDEAYEPAMAVDGMIMMTQYDIPWREDIFQKWDFYDISQCFEFRRHGYEAAVLLEKEPSVVHDYGFTKLWNYDEGRAIFCEEYAEYGFECGEVTVLNYAEVKQLVDKFLQSFDLLMKQNVDALVPLIDKIYEARFNDANIATLKMIFDIYRREKEHGDCPLFVKKGDTWKALVERYTQYKFLIRDAEFGITKEAKKELRNALLNKQISEVALVVIGQLVTCDWDYFLQVVMKDIVR